nr:MAG TPA: Protein of unknown function (DUF1284) [Caudoviricetes sp.]
MSNPQSTYAFNLRQFCAPCQWYNYVIVKTGFRHETTHTANRNRRDAHLPG